MSGDGSRCNDLDIVLDGQGRWIAASHLYSPVSLGIVQRVRIEPSTVYPETECPAAANPIVSGFDGADALPRLGQTDGEKVTSNLDRIRDYLVSTGDAGSISDVRVVRRVGEVWYPTSDTGLYDVTTVWDYQYEAVLAADASCPGQPYSIDGVPVEFTRGQQVG